MLLKNKYWQASANLIYCPDWDSKKKNPCVSFAKTTIQLHEQPMIAIEHGLSLV